MQPKFQIYPEQRNELGDNSKLESWRWRFLAGNGENTANGSEGYASEGNAQIAVRRHCEHILAMCSVADSERVDGVIIEVVDQ